MSLLGAEGGRLPQRAVQLNMKAEVSSHAERFAYFMFCCDLLRGIVLCLTKLFPSSDVKAS